MSEFVDAVCPSSLASAPSAARRRRARRFRAAFSAGARCVRGGAPGLWVIGKDIEQEEASHGTGNGAGHEPRQESEADYPRGRLCNSDTFGGPWVDGPACREPQLDSTRNRRVALPASGSSMATDTNSPRNCSGAILVAEASASGPPGQSHPLLAQNSDSLVASDGSGNSAHDESHNEHTQLLGDCYTLEKAHASRVAPVASPMVFDISSDAEHEHESDVEDTSQKPAERKREEDGQTDETATGRQEDRTACAATSQMEAVVSWLLEQMQSVVRGPKRYFFRRMDEHEHESDVEDEVPDDLYQLDADTLDTIYEIVAELSFHSLQWVPIALVIKAAEELGRARHITALSLQNWCILDIMTVDKQRALIRFKVQPLIARDEQ